MRDFRSTISFYDFRYREHDFIEYDAKSRNALEALSALPELTETSLSELLKTEPALLFALEGILRDQRFRNGQWVHFLFDVQVLNRPLDETTKRYIALNLQQDPAIKSICAGLLPPEQGSDIASGRFPTSADTWDTLAGTFKEATLLYVRKKAAILARLQNPAFERERRTAAAYLIKEFGLDRMRDGAIIRRLAETKRRPRDIRKIHGDYGQERVREALAANRIRESDGGSGEYEYREQCRLEKVATTAGRQKVFDFVVYHSGRPVLAIETNFYESEGTKIGINIAEYAALNGEVSAKSPARFTWVTDGPVWLTPGRTRMLRSLYSEFGGRIYNYVTFRRDLPALLRML